MQVSTERFLSRRELCARWGMGVSTLERWAVQGRGPVARKFGRTVRYALDDVLAYEREAMGA